MCVGALLGRVLGAVAVQVPAVGELVAVGIGDRSAEVDLERGQPLVGVGGDRIDHGRCVLAVLEDLELHGLRWLLVAGVVGRAVIDHVLALSADREFGDERVIAGAVLGHDGFAAVDRVLGRVHAGGLTAAALGDVGGPDHALPGAARHERMDLADERPAPRFVECGRYRVAAGGHGTVRDLGPGGVRGLVRRDPPDVVVEVRACSGSSTGSRRRARARPSSGSQLAGCASTWWVSGSPPPGPAGSVAESVTSTGPS